MTTALHLVFIVSILAGLIHCGIQPIPRIERLGWMAVILCVPIAGWLIFWLHGHAQHKVTES